MRLDEFKNMEEVSAYLRKEKGLKTTAEIRKYLFRELPDEGYYQTKIIKYLKNKYPLSFVWKAAAGPYSRQGIPDINAVIDGKFYGFEVKRPFIGRATELQLQTIKRIKKAGGAAGIVTYISDVEKIIKEDG